MENKLKKILGLKKTEFDELVNQENGILLRQAQLIPTYKPGDEMALSSVFLSSLRLIREFKRDFFNEARLINSGVFPQFEESRIDGFIIVVKGGIIKDAVIIEIKNKNNILDKVQIEKYIDLAKKLCIPKLITISNQFVSEPSQSPLNIKIPKNLEMYHFSWSYILTLAHILLFDNENNIEDEDQVEIMKEVVSYFTNNVSGICGFTQMRQGWKDVVNKINAGTRLKQTDPIVIDTVTSWQQEEKDMALILSRKLGLLVKSGYSKFKGNLKLRIENDSKKGNLKLRIENDSKNLITDKQLISTLKVKGAVSDITVRALFEKRIVEMSVTLNVPLDKKIKGQIGWLKRQLDFCNKKNPDIFETIKNELKININIKHAKGIERISYDRLDSIHQEFKNKEIKEFGIVQVKDFGKKFAASQKFVEVLEKMLLDFYKGVIQYLSRWEQPAPKLTENNSYKTSE
jgi:hypothetical protein